MNIPRFAQRRESHVNLNSINAQKSECLPVLYECTKKFSISEEDFDKSQHLRKFKETLNGLNENGDAERIRLIQDLGKAEICGYTLIQHCCKTEGLGEFLKALLDAYVSPNEVLDGSSYNDNVNASVLLAAENANAEALKLLIDHNIKAHTQEKRYTKFLNEGFSILINWNNSNSQCKK